MESYLREGDCASAGKREKVSGPYGRRKSRPECRLCASGSQEARPPVMRVRVLKEEGVKHTGFQRLEVTVDLKFCREPPACTWDAFTDRCDDDSAMLVSFHPGAAGCDQHAGGSSFCGKGCQRLGAAPDIGISEGGALGPQRGVLIERAECHRSG